MLIDKLLRRIEALNLNLKGTTVLTEAASGAYAVTPIIAALAGAKVYAFTKSTNYGSIDEIFNNTRKLINQFEKWKLDISLIDKLTPEIISKADIITNSGHLRPLDQEKLQYAKDSLVISLMYEAWEWRDSDMDISYIKKRGFRVGATNERHPEVDVFNYLGDMALKMIFDAGLCAYKNNFILICNNDFGHYIAKTLSKVCGSLAVCDIDENRQKYSDLQIDWIGNFPEFEVPEYYKHCDAIILSAYPFDKLWIGKENTPILISKLKSEIENPYILRFCGDIDEKYKNEINFYPNIVTSGHMGILPSDIGLDSVIRLQGGGLKVGELMLKNECLFNGYPIVEVL